MSEQQQDSTLEEDLELSLEEDTNEELKEREENINRTQERIKKLSEKVKLTSQERDELAKAKEKLEVKSQSLEKERDFYSDFSNSIARYPNAGEYKDAIKEKVLSGYSVEDATVAILVKEGKYQAPPPVMENAAGGSATNSSLDSKSIGEMTQEERRQALTDAEASGEFNFH